MKTPSKIVLIGASTGGPGQIEKIIKELPLLKDSAIIIAQHMSVGFMHSFSRQLQAHNQNTILVAADKDYLEIGKVYTCCGDIKLKQDNLGVYFIKKALGDKSHFNPDINNVFNSFLPICKSIEILCVILTGIGRDGVDACKALSLCGCKTITEDEKSSIVDGMTGKARAEVKDIKVMSIDAIAKDIKEFCS